MPDLRPSERFILDIGCGIGQTFVALDCADRVCVGIDVDESSIRYGMVNYGDKVSFILGDAARIPMPSAAFDLVFSRVSLPYTNIPKVFREIRRVLRPGGRVWMTLHTKEHLRQLLDESPDRGTFKGFVYRAYALLNGYLLKHFGVLLPFTRKRYESWQDLEATRRMLARHGFDVQVRSVGKHTVIEGTMAGA